jgi:hypothetical protein
MTKKVLTASAQHSATFAPAKLKKMFAGARYIKGKEFSLNICVFTPLRFPDTFGVLK